MQAPDYYTKLDSILTLPEHVVTLDVESAYDTEAGYTLRKMSTEEYVRDPRFQLHGLALKVGSKPARYAAGHARADMLVRAVPWHKTLMIAHNARFDGFVLSHLWGVQPAMIVDTMSLASVVCGHNLPSASLDALSKRFLPEELRKKPGEALANVDGKWELTAQEQKALGAYAKHDVIAAYWLYRAFKLLLEGMPQELHLTDAIIRMFTDPQLLLDEQILEEIVEQEAREKEELVERCVANVDQLMSNPQLAAVLLTLGVDPPLKISPSTGKETFAFAKSDREFIALTMHEDRRVRDVVSARLRVKSTIDETRCRKYAEVARRGTWPVGLTVSGARTTHRLTGNEAGGGNPQNLSNTDKSRIRYAILCPPDHHMMVVDSSGIDMRVTMTISGEEEVVARLRDPDFNLYRAYAAHTYQVDEDEVLPAQMKLGKVSVLGLGYGCGGPTFREQAWGRGVELTLEEAEEAKNTYRATFSRVPESWYALDRALHALERGEVYELPFDHLVRPSLETISGCAGLELAYGPPITYPKLGFRYNAHKGKEELSYVTYKPRRRSAHASQTRGSDIGALTRVKGLWGSKAFGHICQSLARNIALVQSLAATKFLQAKVHPECKYVMSVHDEGVWLLPDKALGTVTPEDVQAAVIEIFSTSPPWWPDIPLLAKGSISKLSYGDCK